MGQHLGLPLYQHLLQVEAGSGDDLDTDASTTQSNKQLFAAAATLAAAVDVVTDALVTRLAANFPGLADHADVQKSLSSYGVDSLVAIELRTWFANEFGSDIAIFEIVGEMPIAQFAALVAKKSSFKQAAWFA